MSDTNVDPPVDDPVVQSKRREQVIVMIAVVSTILGFKILLTWGPSPLRTGFDAFAALFIAYVVVFFAEVGASFIWSPSVWPQNVADRTQYLLLLADAALFMFLNRPSLWFFCVIWIFWVHNLANLMTPTAAKLHVSVRPSANQQMEPQSLPV